MPFLKGLTAHLLLTETRPTSYKGHMPGMTSRATLKQEVPVPFCDTVILQHCCQIRGNGNQKPLAQDTISYTTYEFIMSAGPLILHTTEEGHISQSQPRHEAKEHRNKVTAIEANINEDFFFCYKA